MERHREDSKHIFYIYIYIWGSIKNRHKYIVSATGERRHLTRKLRSLNPYQTHAVVTQFTACATVPSWNKWSMQQFNKELQGHTDNRRQALAVISLPYLFSPWFHTARWKGPASCGGSWVCVSWRRRERETVSHFVRSVPVTVQLQTSDRTHKC